MYSNGSSVRELWAVLDGDGCVKWSRGGRSTRPHLMVYPTENAAIRAVQNWWTKQVVDLDAIRVKRIYVVSEEGDS